MTNKGLIMIESSVQLKFSCWKWRLKGQTIIKSVTIHTQQQLNEWIFILNFLGNFWKIENFSQTIEIENDENFV